MESVYYHRRAMNSHIDDLDYITANHGNFIEKIGY